MPAVSDAVWSEQGTTPDAIEAALRGLLAERHSEDGGFLPARVLNMVAFVEGEYSGEIANRLRGVGRYHASRLVVLSYDPHRTRLDAHASVAAEGEATHPGDIVLLHETVIVELGDRHLDDLLTIADPLVVSDLPTLLWSPHGHPEAVQALLPLAQATLLDSVDEPVWAEAIDRANTLSDHLYVVDLAWLRSTPWRERIAATFDPPALRGELERISSIAIRHHPDSTVAGMLLIGWLSSRLGWRLAPLQADEGTDGTVLSGVAQADGRAIALRLESAPEQLVRGLAGLSIETASGIHLRLDRGAGGLRAYQRDGEGREHEWTILGASRGEAGILGEGIRQALLRDPTYRPALQAAQQMLP
jgi:glucose-6-phosphate dehydrogenase assembly protein OpcA